MHARFSNPLPPNYNDSLEEQVAQQVLPPPPYTPEDASLLNHVSPVNSASTVNPESVVVQKGANNLSLSSSALFPPVSSIPAIPFNKSELMEIVECFQEGQEQLLRHLDDIETQLSIVRKNHSLTDVADALGLIENHANSIFTENKFSDQTLANTLKRKILQIIQPTKAIVEKEMLAFNPNDFVELNGRKLAPEEIQLKSKLLLAEQSFIARQSKVHKVLLEHLHMINKLLIEDTHRMSPHCYIVYTPPTDENKGNEYWVKPFLTVLYEHLTAAGIRVIMHSRDMNIGDRYDLFIQRYKDRNDVVLIGTPSLLEYFIRTEHTHSLEKLAVRGLLEKQNKDEAILPLLISGTPKAAFPSIFEYNSTEIVNAYGGYLATLKLLINFLLRKQIIGYAGEYRQIWNQLVRNIEPIPENNEFLTREINQGYHKRYSEELGLDVSCLRDQVRQEMLAKQPTLLASQVPSYSPDLFKAGAAISQAALSIPKRPSKARRTSEEHYYEESEVKIWCPNSPKGLIGNPESVNADAADFVGGIGGANSADLVGGPGGANAPAVLVGGPGGLNFLSSRKPSHEAPPLDLAEDVETSEENHRTKPFPGGMTTCPIS
jgi:hypothetical protein